MKLKILLLSFLAVFLLGGSALAITVDGYYTDWFTNQKGFQVTDGIANDITGAIDSGYYAGIYWAEEDYVGTDTYLKVWPGYGGQTFDHEGLYFTQDSNNYYIGLMTGMAPGANQAWWSSTNHYIGDIALDLGRNGSFDTALSMQDIRDAHSSPTIELFENVTSWNNTSSFQPVYNPTPYVRLDGEHSGATISFAYQYSDNSYFYEFGISRSDLDLSDGVNIFVTMDCGNDWLQTNVPVPEPATMLLFGSGLIGLAVVGRRKFFKKS